MAARRGNGRKPKAPAAVASGVGAQPVPSTQQKARLLAAPAEAPAADPGAQQQRPTALQTAASKVQQVAAAAASPVVGLAKKLTPRKPAAAPGGDAVVPTRLFPVEEDSEQEDAPDDDTAPAAMADQLLSFDAPQQQRSSSATPSAGTSTPQPRSKQQPGSSAQAANAEDEPQDDPAAMGAEFGPCAESATQRMRNWAASGKQHAAAAMGQGLQRLRSACSQVTRGHLMGAAGCLLALLCILLLSMAASTSRLHQQQASKLAEQQAAALQQQEVLAAMQKSLLQVQQQLAQLPALQQQLQDTSTNYSSSAAGLHQQQQQLVQELQQLQAQVAGVANATAAAPAPSSTNSGLLQDPQALHSWVSEVVTQQAEARARNLATPGCGAYVANHTQLAGNHGAALRLGLLAQRAMGRPSPHLHPAATAVLLGGGPLQPQAPPRCLKLVAPHQPSTTADMADVEGQTAPSPAQVVIQLPGPANISQVVLLLVAPDQARLAAPGVPEPSSSADKGPALAMSATEAGSHGSVRPAASAVEVEVHHASLGAVQPVATAQWPAEASQVGTMATAGPAGSQLHTLELTMKGNAVGDAVSVRLWSAAAAGRAGEGAASDSAAPAMVCLHRVLVLGRPVAAAAHHFMC